MELANSKGRQFSLKSTCSRESVFNYVICKTERAASVVSLCFVLERDICTGASDDISYKWETKKIQQTNKQTHILVHS
jgi:hypothetical protein